MSGAEVEKIPMQTVIRNIGQVVSGDMAAPLLDADTIVCADGKIARSAGRRRRTTPPTPRSSTPEGRR